MTSKDAPKPGQKPGKNKTQARSAARLYAVQALFQMEQSDQSTNKVIVEFEDHRFGATYEGDEYAEGDTKLFRKLVNDAVNYQAKIDQIRPKGGCRSLASLIRNLFSERSLYTRKSSSQT